MRFRVLAVVITLIVIFGSQIPLVRAETVIVVTDDDELLEPVMFGNKTTKENYDLETFISGFSVTEDGRMFTVSQHPLSQYIHGPTEVSLIAWGSDGTALWTYLTTHFDKKYYDVTHDDSFVYVAGRYDLDILIEKYNFEGVLVWNSTIDLGQFEEGYEIFVMSDGTIIIGGCGRSTITSTSVDYFLLALNQTGHIQWAYGYERYPSPEYDSGYLYITTGDFLQKLDSTGSTVWSVDCSEGRVGCVKDDIVYTTNSIEFIEMYDDAWSIFSTRCYTMIAVTSWNSETGEEMNSSTLKLCDVNNQPFNSSRGHTAVGPDGEIWIQMKAREMRCWYLTSLDQTTELTSIFKVIDFDSLVYQDYQWGWVRFEMDNDGNAYIAATSESFGYVVMKFDSSQLASTETSTSTSITVTTTGTNGFAELGTSQIIGVAFIAVVIIDLYLVVLLKQRWSAQT